MKIAGVVLSTRRPSGERVYPAEHIALGSASTLREEEGWSATDVYRLPEIEPGYGEEPVPDAENRRPLQPASRIDVFLED